MDNPEKLATQGTQDEEKHNTTDNTGYTRRRKTQSLLIFSGNKAFRTKYSDVGAWFIHVLLQIIEDSYEVDHFEDMLISVRHKIALDPKWRRSEYCQMPCSWTTLTKRFYLR